MVLHSFLRCVQNCSFGKSFSCFLYKGTPHKANRSWPWNTFWIIQKYPWRFILLMDGELMGLHPGDLLRTLGGAFSRMCLPPAHSQQFSKDICVFPASQTQSTACAHPPSCTCLWSELSVITLWSGRSSVRLVPWHHRTRSDLSTPESAPLTSAHAPASPHCLPVSEGSQAALLPIPLKKPPFLPPLPTTAPHLSRQALLTQFLRPEILRSLFVSDPTISPAVGPDTSSFTRPKSAPSLGPPHFPYLLWGCSLPSGWTTPVAC